jgi:hypothetical protein
MAAVMSATVSRVSFMKSLRRSELLQLSRDELQDAIGGVALRDGAEGFGLAHAHQAARD